MLARLDISEDENSLWLSIAIVSVETPMLKSFGDLIDELTMVVLLSFGKVPPAAFALIVRCLVRGVRAERRDEVTTGPRSAIISSP